MKRMLTFKSGQKLLLMGNEAIVRGALEAGIGLASTYPGTPASEIGDTFAVLAKDAGIYFEYSTNEKVAAEVAAAAAFAGVRSLVSFKHFGLNVASDSVFPLAYHGVRGGMLIVFSDDPQCWSSGQSEQDSRYYARMAHMPMLEPSDSQECLEFTKKGFELSEKLGIPVIIRLTTRVAHTRGIVKLGDIKKGKTIGDFPEAYREQSKWRNMPPKILSVHNELNEKLAKLASTHGKSFTRVIRKKSKNGGPAGARFGIITSGISFEYVMGALNVFGMNVPVLKLGMTWPVPDKEIASFIKPLKEVLIIEELEAVLENEVRRVAKGASLKLLVRGKDLLASHGEFRAETLLLAICSITGKRMQELERHRKKLARVVTPPRQPVFCPGCPHRSTFYAVKRACPKGTIFGGDIGCYVLGMYAPYEAQDFMLSMGAGQGVCHGFSKSTKASIVSFMGDGTFFHAGFPGLVNSVFNRSSQLVVILDNRITAMTGHQPNAGSGITAMGEKTKEISIEEVVRACRVDSVAVTSAFNVSQTSKLAAEMLAKPGVNVLISKGECRLLFRRRMRRQGVALPVFEIDPSRAGEVGESLAGLACPAIHVDEKGNYYIDKDFCWGCGVCAQLAPAGAITARKTEARE